MRIAVEGCCHGELDKIYETLQHLETREQTQIDLLICCGDFQAVRNYDDLTCLACPDKYKQLNTFWKYYSGAATAPYLTVFIGGNHEASNYLAELPFGGWVAPKIYFLGNAGIVNFGGVRIGGLTGIFNQRHYRMGHFEVPPYTESSMRSAYHVRELDVWRLMQLRQPLDVFLSHDWPSRIADHGNKAQLCRYKKFLAKEIMDGSLGSPPAAQLLKELQPAYWFSAHMHVKFPAVVPHAAPHASRASDQPACTHFLALDKCLPGRGFLQVVDFPEASGPKELCYDKEWLAVLRSTHRLMRMQQRQPPLPGHDLPFWATPSKGARRSVPPEQTYVWQQPEDSQGLLDAAANLKAEWQSGGGQRLGPPLKDLDAIEDAFKGRGSCTIPHNFQPTAPCHDPQGGQRRGSMPKSLPRNPQTLALLAMLGLPYNLDPPTDGRGFGNNHPAPAQANPEEIDLDAVSNGDAAAVNPEEIDLDGLEEPPDAGAAEANPEEIDLDGLDEPLDAGAAETNPEEIDLGEVDEDESPSDKLTDPRVF
ncbi:hypothetical protein WJX74_003551 [Apatococcus lobatus]|uniref:Lariat debranching enzyme C-terminal domain-containing protein n=1 Tax=Apatococcus lobatus TaxID=904363 RepID=A0AAW1RLD2_9CHLO